MICKKVTRFLVISLITVFAVFSSAPPAKADTIQAHGTVSTSYGSYTWSAQQAASTLPITVSLPYVGISFAYNSGTSFSIDYSFKNQYSGVVTITVTGNNTWSVDNVNILTSGCNLDSLPSDHAQYKTSHSFNLRLKNSDKFSFVIYGAGATVFLGSTSVSIAHNMSVDNLEQQIDSTLDLYMPGMSTSLSNLYSGIGYDGNSSTSLQADTLAYDISIIKNYIDGIEGYLSVGNSYIDQLEGYVDGLENQLAQINTYLNNVNYIMRFNNIEAWQYNALCWPWYNTNANTVTYSYERGLIYFNYSTSNNNGAYYDPKCIKIPAYGHLGFYFYTDISISSADVHIYASNSNTDLSGMVLQNNFFQSGGPYYKNLIHFENKSNSFIYITLEFSKNMKVYPLFLGNISNTPDAVADLYGIEYGNTYTRLLQQIVSAVGTISQTQINENNTNINNYNNYQTQINNVENNYYNEYNTYNTDIQNNNTFDFSGLSSDGVTVYQNLFTSVFQIDLIKWPLIIILLGLIVVIILG